MKDNKNIQNSHKIYVMKNMYLTSRDEERLWAFDKTIKKYMDQII